MAARAALRPRMDALYRASDWQAEAAAPAPVSLPGEPTAARAATALLAMPLL